MLKTECIEKIIELEEFVKDYSKRLKKFRNLEKDIEKFKKVLLDRQLLQEQKEYFEECANTNCSKRIFYIYKKLRSFDLKCSDRMRIIVFVENNILFLQEIYYKTKFEDKATASRFSKYCGMTLEKLKDFNIG